MCPHKPSDLKKDPVTGEVYCRNCGEIIEIDH